MKTWQWSAALAAAVVLCSTAWMVMAPSPDEDDLTDVLVSPNQGRHPGASSPNMARPGTTLEQRLAGAEPLDPSQLFDIGFAGGLSLDMDTSAALELISGELGSTPSPDDIKRVEGSIRSGLPTAAAEQAIAMLHQHRAYTASYARLFDNPPENPSVEDERALHERVEALQRQHFGEAAAQAMFGVQNAHSRYSLEVQAIQADSGLPAADKAQRIQALRAALPPDVLDLVVASEWAGSDADNASAPK